MATVYFIEAPEHNLVKIGITTGRVKDRLKIIRSMSPAYLRLRCTIDNVDYSVETLLHFIFSDSWHHNEWFEINDDLENLMQDPNSFDIYSHDICNDKIDIDGISGYLKKLDNQLDYMLKFGQYKYKLLSEVIELDIIYTKWIIQSSVVPLNVRKVFMQMLILSGTVGK